MKRLHVAIVALCVAVTLVALFSTTIAELCQHRERQFGGLVWGQHAFHESPSLLICIERIID